MKDRSMRASTYNESLMEIRAKHALLPVVPNDTANSIGHRLLDSEGETTDILGELGIKLGMVAARDGRSRRERRPCYAGPGE